MPLRSEDAKTAERYAAQARAALREGDDVRAAACASLAVYYQSVDQTKAIQALARDRR